jgi:hypothetical protein
VVVGGRAFAGSEQRAAAIGADRLAGTPQALSDPPPAAGDDVVVAEEALRLDTAPAATVDDLLAQVVQASAEHAGLPAAQHDRVRQDVRWIVRYTGAAVLTDDPSVLDDLLGSMLRMPHDGVPDSVVLDQAEVVSGGLETLAPGGATMLRSAVRRARAAG